MSTGDLQQCMLAVNDQPHRQYVWAVPGMGWLEAPPGHGEITTCIEQVNRGQPVLFDMNITHIEKTREKRGSFLSVKKSAGNTSVKW